MFSSNILKIILGLKFNHLIHFELTFKVRYEITFQFHSLACGYTVSPTSFIKETALPLSPLCILGNFHQTQLTTDMGAYFEICPDRWSVYLGCGVFFFNTSIILFFIAMVL